MATYHHIHTNTEGGCSPGGVWSELQLPEGQRTVSESHLCSLWYITEEGSCCLTITILRLRDSVRGGVMLDGWILLQCILMQWSVCHLCACIPDSERDFLSTHNTVPSPGRGPVPGPGRCPGRSPGRSHSERLFPHYRNLAAGGFRHGVASLDG